MIDLHFSGTPDWLERTPEPMALVKDSMDHGEDSAALVAEETDIERLEKIAHGAGGPTCVICGSLGALKEKK